tara:strand:- start:182 stop:1177 length:996 start_codon:yes stop_codon:yes gene_type:complete
MKVGFQTTTDNKYQSIQADGLEASPVMVSVAQKKDNSMDKFLVWHIEGGLGKNVAATALLPSLAKRYRSRKIIVVASYPEVFLNHPDVYRVFRVGMTQYFYEDYILGKDTIVFRHEPYFQTGHILKQKHLVQNWAELLGVDYQKQLPNIHMNMVQKNFAGSWQREKPVLLLQTNGGLFSGQQHGYSWTRDIPLELAVYIAEKTIDKYHIIQLTRENTPILQGVEVINQPMTNMELFSLAAASEKRVLIDSCLQHASAALNLPSTVFWIGTAPENFGYDMHTNIKALPPKGNTKLIDAYLFDASFEGVPHECPYNDIKEMFDLKQIDAAING